jgi:hypothetical protein
VDNYERIDNVTLWYSRNVCTTNGCVHHPPRPNPQRQKWVTTQSPAHALYPFVCLFRHHLTSPHHPRVEFESMGCFLPHFLRWVIHVISVCGCGTRGLYRGRRVLVQGRWQLIRHYNRLHGGETGSKTQETDRTLPHCLILLWCLCSRMRKYGRRRRALGEGRFLIIPDATRDTRCSISDGREIHAHEPQYHVVRCVCLVVPGHMRRVKNLWRIGI